jgi:exosortase
MNFVFAWRFRMAYPQALSLVGAVFGLTLLFGGWSVMRVAWFPIAFLVLAVPFPDRYYVELSMPLRRWASTAAAALMPLLADGLHTEAQAVVIDYIAPGRPPGTLNVEEACSGMRLLMAFVTLGVAMAYLGERPWWQRAIMIAFCIPIALVCNTIRVTMTGLLYVYGDVSPAWLQTCGIASVRDLAQGTPHQMLGLLMLLIALGCYAVIGYVLSHLLVEDNLDFGAAPASSFSSGKS